MAHCPPPLNPPLHGTRNSSAMFFHIAVYNVVITKIKLGGGHVHESVPFSTHISPIFPPLSSTRRLSFSSLVSSSTNPCSPSSTRLSNDTARICCCVPCCGGRRCCCVPAPAIDHYLMPVQRSAANPPHAASVVERRERQTDGRVDGQTDRQTGRQTDTRLFHSLCSTHCAGSVNEKLKNWSYTSLMRTKIGLLKILQFTISG